MREIDHESLLEACALLGIDPERTKSFTVTMEGRAGGSITVTEPLRVTNRIDHDPF